MTGPAILCGDARALPLPDGSVDLICTSPPYFGIREYASDGDGAPVGGESTPQEFVSTLLDATREMSRVLTFRGSIFVNLADCYAAYNGNRGDGQLQTNTGQSRPIPSRGLFGGGAVRNKSLMLIPERYRIACADELGLIARAVIFWRKRPSMPAGRIRDRVRTVHEDWVHLTRTDRYHYDEDALRALGAGQMPPSVWDAPVARGGEHPAMFPFEWPRRLIAGWCPIDGVVLDPFGGAGTTALAANAMGRIGISVDASQHYCDLAVARAADPKERARAAGFEAEAVATIRPEVPGQVSMLDLLNDTA